MDLQSRIQDLLTSVKDLEEMFPEMDDSEKSEALCLLREVEQKIDDFTFSLEP